MCPVVPGPIRAFQNYLPLCCRVGPWWWSLTCLCRLVEHSGHVAAVTTRTVAVSPGISQLVGASLVLLTWGDRAGRPGQVWDSPSDLSLPCLPRLSHHPRMRTSGPALRTCLGEMGPVARHCLLTFAFRGLMRGHHQILL